MEDFVELNNASRTYELSHTGSVLSSEDFSDIISNLNTEAKCISFAFTPYELTSLSDINENLRVFGAFDSVDSKTFNVSGLLKCMPDFMVTTISLPLSVNTDKTKLWAKKPTEVLGNYLDGFSGKLLELSSTSGFSLRSIIGERRIQKNAYNAIELRLGVLGLILSELRSSDTNSVDKNTIIKSAKEIFEFNNKDVASNRVNTTLRNISRDGIISLTESKNTQKIEFTKPDDKKPTHEVIESLFKVIGKLLIEDESTLTEGHKFISDIRSQEDAISALIEKSYSSTRHTGKKTKQQL
jgi:hypothetical protein